MKENGRWIPANENEAVGAWEVGQMNIHDFDLSEKHFDSSDSQLGLWINAMIIICGPRWDEQMTKLKKNGYLT